jgi:hypothetical protein
VARRFSWALLWAARIGFTGGLLVALAWIGHFPIGSPEREGLLRLAWRMSGAQVRICVERSEEELMRLAPHMRQRLACEDHVVPYRLALTLNGEPRVERLVTPRGAKGDRPIYVQEELKLPPGEYALAVEFEPAPREEPDEDEEDGERKGEDDQVDKARQALSEAIAKAPRYRLDEPIRTAAGRITLIELDESSRELKIYGP